MVWASTNPIADRAWMPVRRFRIIRSLRSRSNRRGQVSRRLRAFREEADLTQERLAQRSNVAVNTISEIENGHLNPSVAVMAKLVEQGLDLPLAAFFAADTPGELRDDLAKLEALFAGQSAAMRRRALRVLKALCDE
jgi:transcriptional regulator with XRE-family HTH domain